MALFLLPTAGVGVWAARTRWAQAMPLGLCAWEGEEGYVLCLTSAACTSVPSCPRDVNSRPPAAGVIERLRPTSIPGAVLRPMPLMGRAM